jgi:hypothetical protein
MKKRTLNALCAVVFLFVSAPMSLAEGDVNVPPKRPTRTPVPVKQKQLTTAQQLWIELATLLARTRF